MTHEKLLDKLQKIKAHAESAAKIGSEAEAEAFAAMLQQLLLKHKLGMTDLEFEAEEAEETVRQHSIKWEGVKVRKARVAWIENLAGIVAHAYFCRILVHPGSSHITLVGRQSDAAIAEYMIVTLVRLASKLAKKEFGKVYRQDRSAATGFQASFLRSFTQRLKERFAEERRTAEDSTSTALVRINRAEEAVADFFKDNAKNFRKSAMVRGTRRDPNALGWRRGRDVADSMDLRGNAVESGSKGSSPKLR